MGLARWAEVGGQLQGDSVKHVLLAAHAFPLPPRAGTLTTAARSPVALDRRPSTSGLGAANTVSFSSGTPLDRLLRHLKESQLLKPGQVVLYADEVDDLAVDHRQEIDLGHLHPLSGRWHAHELAPVRPAAFEAGPPPCCPRRQPPRCPLASRGKPYERAAARGVVVDADLRQQMARELGMEGLPSRSTTSCGSPMPLRPKCGH